MQLEQLVKLAPLAETMSPTNQEHIFDLARLAVQSSLTLKTMGLLDPAGEWNRRYLVKVPDVNQRLNQFTELAIYGSAALGAQKVIFIWKSGGSKRGVW